MEYDKRQSSKIKAIVSVRNQFAHSWSEKEVSYKRDPSNDPISLVNNIVVFKKDAEDIWIELIEHYIKLEFIFIGRLKSRLKDRTSTEKIILRNHDGVYYVVQRVGHTLMELKYHLVDGHSHEDLADMIANHGWSI